tara:strand:- start:21287 stop:22366 length:1080 start_codon:yes stop_codon:yes gene_type:complete
MLTKDICVISTVHPDYDNRIIKQCVSLQNNHRVDLIIQSERESVSGININPLPIVFNRRSRIKIFFLALLKSLKKNYDIYIIHDPELLLMALILRLFSKNVIYDIHEDYEEEIKDKEWISRFLRKIISFAFARFEKLAIKSCYSIICATPYIKEKFESHNSRCFGIYNYPPKDELYKQNLKKNEIFTLLYVGNISFQRGIIQILDSINDIDCLLIIAGNFANKNTEDKCLGHASWKKVDYRGFISREEFCHVMAQADLGLLLFQPRGNHINSQPNKLFEYMSGGLFQLSSNFQHWNKILLDQKLGFTVDPENTSQINYLIKEIKNNKDYYRSIRSNIRDIFVRKYSWESQVPGLLQSVD